MAMTSLPGINPYGGAYSPYRPSNSYGPVNTRLPQTLPALAPLPPLKPPGLSSAFPTPAALPATGLNISSAPPSLPGNNMPPANYYPVVRAYYVPVPVSVPTPPPLTQSATPASAIPAAPAPAAPKTTSSTVDTSLTEAPAGTPADPLASDTSATNATSPTAAMPLSREEQVGKQFGDLITKILKDNPELLQELETSPLNLDDPSAAMEELRRSLRPVLRFIPDSLEEGVINRMDPTMQPVGRRLLNWIKGRPTSQGVTSSAANKPGPSGSASATDPLDSIGSTDPLSDPLSDSETGTGSSSSARSTSTGPHRSHASSSSSSSDLNDPFAEDPLSEPAPEKRRLRDKLNPFSRKKKEEADPFAESGSHSHGSSPLDEFAL